MKNSISGRISIVIDSGWAEPASDSEEDVMAAQIERDFVVRLTEVIFLNWVYFFQLGIYANPIYIGNWPEVVIQYVGERSELEGFPKSRLPELSAEEITFINGTSDFFCLNTYVFLCSIVQGVPKLTVTPFTKCLLFYRYSTNYITPGNKVDENIGEPSYSLDKGK